MKAVVVKEIEKRELIEQERKIFEAGVQRADKRTSSFSFLTWSFFIAPLIACEEFLAASFKSVAAEEQEDAKATQAGASHQANDEALASDPGKTSADDETGPAASAQAHATGIDPTGLLAEPHENAPKPSTARSEAVAAESGGGGGGGGGGRGGNNGDNTDSHHRDAHTSIDDSSVNSLSAHSYLASQSPGRSTFDPAPSNVLGDSFCPSVIGSAQLPETVGSVTNETADTLAPVEAVVQPVLTTATDAVGTLTNEVADTLAPVEAVVQPVLTTATDAVGTLTNEVADTLAPVEAVVQPVMTTATDTVGTLTNEVADTLAPVEAVVQPLLTTATDAVGTLTNEVADTLAPVEVDPVGNLAAHAPAAAVDPALPPTPSDDTGSSSHGVTDASNVAEHPVESAGSVAGALTPVLPDTGDALQVATPDTTSGLANHTVVSAEPAVDTADPLLAPMTGAANQSTALSQTTASDDAGAHTLGNSAPALEVAELAPVPGTGAIGDAPQPGDVASDALASAAPVVDNTEPVLTNAGLSPSDPADNLVQPSAPETSTDHSSGPADTLMALATATDAPIEVPGSATAAPAIAVASVDQPAIAGDVIALIDAPQPPANALFTGTQYTDYGITLSSDIAVAPQQSASPADAASAHDASELVVAGQKDAPPPPDIVDTTHQIDHLGHTLL